MQLIDALNLPSLKDARVVAGAQGLHRTIRWVHIVDLPDPIPWVRAGDFMLTTGYSWPHDEQKLRKLIIELSKLGLAGLGIAVPHYFQEMPAAACRAAEDLHFPLIEIPWEIQFNTITEEILNSMLAIHYKMNEHSEYIHQELVRIALEAQSLEDIAHTLGRLIDKKVAIQHPDGPILSTYEIDGEDMMSFQADKESLDTLRILSKPERFPAKPESGWPARFVCPITIKRDLVGLLWIIEKNKPLTELEERAAQFAAIVMALHISQQRALASLEAQLGYSFLDSLLEGQFIPSPQALRRAELLGFDPHGIYSVGMMVMASPIPLTREGIVKRERLADKLKSKLHLLGMPAVISLVQNQILFILTDRYPAEEIWRTLQAQELAFAVSLPHMGFDNVKQGYKEVLSILRHLEFGELTHYEAMLVPRILLGDAEARASFLDKTLGSLKNSKGADSLTHTLLSYVRMGFHLKNTANELKIHPKTLRYRLDRIIAIGGFDLNDSETQFHLQLAARMVSWENQSNG